MFCGADRERLYSSRSNRRREVVNDSQIHRWIPLSMCVLFVVVAAQVALTWRTSCSASSMQERITKLERQQERMSDAEELSAEMEGLETQLDELDEEVANLRAMSLYASGKLKRMGIKVDDLDSMESDLTDVFPELDSVIDRKVSEKMAGGRTNKVGPLPTMEALSETLQMTPYQQQKSQQVLNQAKYDAFNIVNTPRADGSTLLGEITDVMVNSDQPRQDGTKVMLKLFYENVPGTDKTYFKALKELQTGTQNDFSGLMTEDQLSTYNNMDVNLFGVQTGYSPLADYLRDFMAQQGQ